MAKWPLICGFSYNEGMAKGENAMPLDLPEDPRMSPGVLLPEASPILAPSPDPEPSWATPSPRPVRSPRSSRSARRRPSQPPYLRRTPKANTATFLYRFYDADDVLLYVGITDNLLERTWSHARASTWMEFAVRSTVEQHAKRGDAEEAEITAIRGECPLFNQAYNDDRDADRRIVDYLIEHDRRDLLVPAVSRG